MSRVYNVIGGPAGGLVMALPDEDFDNDLIAYYSQGGYRYPAGHCLYKRDGDNLHFLRDIPVNNPTPENEPNIGKADDPV